MVLVSDALKLTSKAARKMRASASTVRQRAQMRAHAQFRPDPGHEIDVLLNFPGDTINMYQVRQWYGPLEHLAKTHRVAILCYQPSTAKKISQETRLKVVLTPSYTDLREVENTLKPKVVLYPNQNYANYRILGITSAEHVFVCHGESDKIYMASNWVKVFNYFFVAGDASRDRLKRHVKNYDVNTRAVPIGRPQIDINHDSPLAKTPDRTTVLYSPTWEGGRRTMRYGSVASHGVEIVSSLLATDRFRVIYRPHPRTGIHDERFAAADKKIKDLLKSSNDANDSHHFVDDTPFGWQLDIADVMITDVSAVAYDWLTTAKPLLITRPVEVEAVMPQDGFIAQMRLLNAEEANETARLVNDLLADATERRRLTSWADYYYGDRTPGSSLNRFVTAIDHVIKERDQVCTKSLDSMNPSAQSQQPAPGTRTRQTAPLQQRAAKGANFIYRSFDFATTGIANLAAQTRGESRSVDKLVSAMKFRPSEVLVSTMAGPHDIDQLIDWIPALERLNRRHTVALLAGNQRTYDRLSESTRLRVHIGRSATETEEIFSNLNPTLHLQFEQANLNLRELTHRNVTHVYVGTETDNSWINNRLRAFDVVIGGEQTPPELIRNSLIDFPVATSVVTVPDNTNRDQSRADIVAALMTGANPETLNSKR